MQHLTLHALPRTWLFNDWEEARALWLRLLAMGPLDSLVVMPDHVHLFSRLFEVDAVRGALSGFSRWRHHHRGGQAGPVWRPVSEPVQVQDREHLVRTRRYVLLNPCRGELVTDPLAWPFSTHRDAVGLAIPTVMVPAADPVSFHAYVSGDGKVGVEGTRLPANVLGPRRPGYDAVAAAVSALTRIPVAHVGQRGPHRLLVVQALREFTGLSIDEIARRIGVHPTSVYRVPPGQPQALALVERVMGDGRFPALGSENLTRTAAWARYVAFKKRKKLW